jgi:hypothetical protein
MQHAEMETDQMPGQDSFLDVITNIVGILILLVLVVGVRTSRQVQQASGLDAQATASEEEMKAAVDAARKAQRDVSDLVQRSVNVHGEVLLKEREREYLGTYVATGEQEMEELRSKLSKQQQHDFDLRQKLSAQQQMLNELTREQIALLAETPEVEAVTSLPTPLAETVNGKEVILRLSGGTVSVVPVEQMAKLFKKHAEENVWRLREQDSFVGTVGPVDGYQLRYYVRKRKVSMRNASGMEQQGSVMQMVRYIFTPVVPDIGETVDQAMLPNSDLRRCLAQNPPGISTVTIFAYPDSFDDFRKLKKALFDLGYATAGNPVPAGEPIAFAPHGHRSAAQ